MIARYPFAITQCAGYNQNDVIDAGEVIGRAYKEYNVWSFYGQRDNVRITIKGGYSLSDVAMLATGLFRAVSDIKRGVIMIKTKHAGYNQHDVIDAEGRILGRAYQEHNTWSFYGWNDGVTVTITGRRSLGEVANLANKLFEVVL